MNLELNLNVSYRRLMAKSKDRSVTAQEMSSEDWSSATSSAPPSSHSFLKLPDPRTATVADSFGQSRSNYSGIAEDKDEFYRNLQNVREKIQRLGTVRESADEGIRRLKSATDRYTELLNGRPIREDSFDNDMSFTPSVSVLNASQGDLLEDEGIRKRLEAIQLKISQLENRLDQSSRVLVDKMTSAHGKDRSSSFLDANSHVSDVEKGRSMFIDVLDGPHQAKNNDHVKSLGISSPSPPARASGHLNDWPTKEIPVRDAGVLSRLSGLFADIKADYGHHSPRSISSAGSSLRPLNESQRSKLHQFQDELRREMTGKTTGDQLRSAGAQSDRLPSFAPAAQRRLEFSADDTADYCDRCGLSKKRRCVCTTLETRPQETTVGHSFKNQSSLFALPKTASEIKATEARGTQTDRPEPDREELGKANASCQVSNQYDPAVDSSPARKMSRKTIAAVPLKPSSVATGKIPTEPSKPAPFVTGKSTGPSHSVLVNWQQLLAVLKAQNPTLHEFCLRLKPNEIMSAEFLEVFRREMTELLRMWKQELRELSRDFSAAVQMSTRPGIKGKREIAKKANQMAAQMEAKDTAIQRIQRQLDSVIEAISAKHKRHFCETTATSPVKTKEDHHHHRTHHHHLGPRSKAAPKSSGMEKAILRRRQTAALMRDAKALVTVING